MAKLTPIQIGILLISGVGAVLTILQYLGYLSIEEITNGIIIVPKENWGLFLSIMLIIFIIMWIKDRRE